MLVTSAFANLYLIPVTYVYDEHIGLFILMISQSFLKFRILVLIQRNIKFRIFRPSCVGIFQIVYNLINIPIMRSNVDRHVGPKKLMT